MNIGAIARRARVSTATVSRTLNQNGVVRPETARRVWRAAAALNYFPNSHARALVSGRSRLVGLIVSDITNPFFPELVRQFESLTLQRQYDLILTSTDYQTERMSTCLRRMLERKVDGVALMTSEMDEGLIDELSRRGVPLVFMDVGQVGARMSHVVMEYADGIRQAVDHVVDLGHRRVGFISGPLDLHSARSRRNAFVERLRHHSIAVDTQFVREGTHTAEGGQQAMDALLRGRRRPTAVICSNDWTAIGALHAIDAAGLRVPEDLSLVGFDDTPIASYTRPPLTTVRMSAADIGTTACQALFDLIDHEDHKGARLRIRTTLVVRGSTARIQKSIR
ncbi:MAG TPA: LacI family DNA-binding transcriptional regulator [Vicinamibacterales bacterium]|jgi:DNA-binding LacI/PurR family transcriptional regulator|nr:LacI family DNA-binding transcriptional regulator [Vicinamibacterales bacterium]